MGMIARASVWSWKFFQKVRLMSLAKSPVTHHPWWEQTAMVYLLQLPFTLAHAATRQTPTDNSLHNTAHAPACVLLGQKQLNGYPPIVARALATHVEFQADDFIVSFSGCRIYTSDEVCNEMFLAYFFKVHDAEQHAQDPVL